jgi:hypothetical protein
MLSRKHGPSRADAPVIHEKDLDELLRALATGSNRTNASSRNGNAPKAEKSVKPRNDAKPVPSGKYSKLAASIKPNSAKHVVPAKHRRTTKPSKSSKIAKQSKLQNQTNKLRENVPKPLATRGSSPAPLVSFCRPGEAEKAEMNDQEFNFADTAIADSQASDEGDAQALIEAMKRLRADRDAARARKNATIDSTFRKRMRKDSASTEAACCAVAAETNRAVIDLTKKLSDSGAVILAELMQLGDKVAEDVNGAARNAANIAAIEVAEMKRSVRAARAKTAEEGKVRKKELVQVCEGISKATSVKAKKRLAMAHRLEQALGALSVL